MIRNDFIMRLIELLGAFLVRLTRQIEMGDLTGAAEEIDAKAREVVGVPMAILENNQAENLVSLFSAANDPDYPRIMASGILLDARGQIAFRDGDEISAFLHWIKATLLFLTASNSPDQDIRNRCLSGIDSLVEKLREFDTPDHLHLELARHYENLGLYSLAEEHWFDGTENSENRIELMTAFYNRLLVLPESDLEKGKLTRAEVKACLAEISVK